MAAAVSTRSTWMAVRQRTVAILVAAAAAITATTAAAVAVEISTGHPQAAPLAAAVVVLAWTPAGVGLRRVPGRRMPHVRLALGAAGLGAAGLLAAALDHRGAGDSGGLQVVSAVVVGLLPGLGAWFLALSPVGMAMRPFRRIEVGLLVVAAALTGALLAAQRPALPLWPVAVETGVALAAGWGVMVTDHRRVGPAGRRRFEWLWWSIAVALALAVGLGGIRLLSGWPDDVVAAMAIASLPVPAVIVWASLRPGLPSIHGVLAPTAKLVTLEALLVAGAVAVVGILGHQPSGEERLVLGLGVAAAAVTALLFGPLWHRLFEIVEGAVQSARRTTAGVLRDFGGRLSRGVPLDEVLLEMAESLHENLGLARAEVWTRSGDCLELSASVPEADRERLPLSAEAAAVIAAAGVSGAAWAAVWLPELIESVGQSGDVRVAPVGHLGELLGLVVVYRRTVEPLSADEAELLTGLTRQLGLALHNLRLDTALQSSLDELRRQAQELRASRARIVAASDAARRRIERDLHDGAQQHLVALAVQVRLARQLAERDPAELPELLDGIGEGLRDAVQELRRLAHGIYPPLLMDRGLTEALQSAAGRSPLPVTVESDFRGRLAPAAEAAVYFCCLEALQNAAKHAGGDARVRISLSGDGEAAGLRFAVADDGEGFESGSVAPGTGFVNMADRLGAVGGTLSVTSTCGAGTVVEGFVPA